MTYKLMPAAALVDIDGTLVDVSSVRHHVAGPGKRNFDAFHRESAGLPTHRDDPHLGRGDA